VPQGYFYLKNKSMRYAIAGSLLLALGVIVLLLNANFLTALGVLLLYAGSLGLTAEEAAKIVIERMGEEKKDNNENTGEKS